MLLFTKETGLFTAVQITQICQPDGALFHGYRFGCDAQTCSELILCCSGIVKP
jgi:hypothetical protein